MSTMDEMDAEIAAQDEQSSGATKPPVPEPLIEPATFLPDSTTVQAGWDTPESDDFTRGIGYFIVAIVGVFVGIALCLALHKAS
jgi:hypothetical protein